MVVHRRFIELCRQFAEIRPADGVVKTAAGQFGVHPAAAVEAGHPIGVEQAQGVGPANGVPCPVGGRLLAGGDGHLDPLLPGHIFKGDDVVMPDIVVAVGVTVPPALSHCQHIAVLLVKGHRLQAEALPDRNVESLVAPVGGGAVHGGKVPGGTRRGFQPQTHGYLAILGGLDMDGNFDLPIVALPVAATLHPVEPLQLQFLVVRIGPSFRRGSGNGKGHTLTGGQSGGGQVFLPLMRRKEASP